MQAKATIQERLTHAYMSSKATRLLWMLAMTSAAVLFYLLSGGFPPWAWRLLFQTLPHVSELLALHAQATLLALAGLVLLSLTILLTWLLLLWLAWRMLAYALHARRELRLFAAEMREAHYLAQEEAQYAQNYASANQLEEAPYTWDYPATDQLAEAQYVQNYASANQREEAPYIWGYASTDPLEDEQSSRSYASTDPLEGAWYSQGYASAEHLMDSEGMSCYQHDVIGTYEAELAASCVQRNAPHADEQISRPLSWPDVLYAQINAASVVEHVPTHPLPSPVKRRATVDLVLPDAWEYASTAPLAGLTFAPPAPRSTTQLIVSTALDVGLRRQDKPNEDSLLAIQHTRVLHGASCPVGLFVIADGMGGHENGQEASRLVIRALSAAIAPSLYTGPADDNYMELLSEGMHRANLALYQCNRQKQADMGTTLAAALVVNTTAYIANVGDSRVYLYRSASGLSQVTRDHSTVARLVEAGVIQPDEIYTHPRRNEIYRSLGHQASQDVDTFILALQPGDLLLLCSDGLWEMVRDAQIQEILASDSRQPDQLSATLVQAALDGGGKDNIGVIVVYIQAEEEILTARAS